MVADSGIALWSGEGQKPMGACAGVTVFCVTSTGHP